MSAPLFTARDFCGLDVARPRRGCRVALLIARILEKQNRLQMSQVFSVSCIDDQMGVAFQGFYAAVWPC